MGFLVGQAQCDFILEIGLRKGTNSGMKNLSVAPFIREQLVTIRFFLS